MVLNCTAIVSIVVSTAVTLVALVTQAAEADLAPQPDAQTVYDSTLHVTWLANANLAGAPGGQLGVTGINPSGSMTYATAQRWVAALNDANYLGHRDWTLPTTPPKDPSCSTRGTHDERFGIGCTESALGSVYGSLGLTYPDSAVATLSNSVSPFTNFQPYLYWSGTSAREKGWYSFSFNTGFSGANTDNHVMFVLPMFDGPPPGAGFAPCGQQDSCGLQATPDGTLVYDPTSNVTWLADADFAASLSLSCSTCTINSNGSMTHTSAEAFIDAMNGYNGGSGWLGITTWQLPPALEPDSTCSLGKNTDATYGFGCTGSPMSELYYKQLLGGLAQGTPVAAPSTTPTGPFTGLQSYLYWSCQQAADDPTHCGGEPAPDFQWSFSFGNGFEGTDVVQNNLYVMVYYPDFGRPLSVPTPGVQPAPTECRAARPGQTPRCV